MGIKILAHIILVILLVVLFPIITTWYVYVALNLLIRELIRGYKNKQKNNPTK
jgi:general stress protein CsbA